MPPAPTQPTRSFASDNNAGVHPEILEAITRANQGHAVAYGDDPYTRSAVKKFEEHFGPDIAVSVDAAIRPGDRGAGLVDVGVGGCASRRRGRQAASQHSGQREADGCQ